MKVKILTSLVVLAAAVGFALLAGCDGDTNSDDLVISPSATLITTNQTITFTVFNGSVITWSVDHPSWATLTVTGPSTVNYTSRLPMPEGPDQVQVLHAHSVKPEDPNDFKDAQATITHEGTAHVSEPGRTVTQLIIEGVTSIHTNSSVPLTASGGTGNYTWDISDPSLGSFSSTTSLSSTTDNPATYFSSTNRGPNTVTVSDSASNSNLIIITTF